MRSSKHEEELVIIKKIREIQSKFSGDEIKSLVFRGVKNSNWPLESSAARRLKNAKESNQRDFIKYHQILLNDIKKGNYKGINSEDLQSMNELQLLAQVQHSGGATCLTDFTTNLLVALWFASEKCSEMKLVPREQSGKVIQEEVPVDQAGKVYVVNLKSNKNEDMIKDVMELKGRDTNTIADILTYKCEENTRNAHFWYWKPQKTNGRFMNQNSIFIFGLPAFTDDLYKEIQITKEEKAIIRQQLKELFGVSVETIFPDLQGFSLTANDHNAPLYKLFNLPCKEIVLNYLRDKKFVDCYRYIDKMQNCFNEKTQCEKMVGTKKCKNSVISINYFKGLCTLERVKEDYNMAKSAVTDGPISYDRLILLQDQALSFFIDGLTSCFDQKQNKISETDAKYICKSMVCVMECIFEMVLCDSFYLLSKQERLTKIDELMDTYTSKHIQVSLRKYRKPNEKDFLLYFKMLELSIFAVSKPLFTKYKDKLITIGVESSPKNSAMLFRFFSCISEELFKWKEIHTPQTVSELLKEMKDEEHKLLWEQDINNSFTYAANWDYSDMKHWLTHWLEKNDVDSEYPCLVILCNEMKRLQEACKNQMFSKEAAYDTSTPKKSSATSMPKRKFILLNRSDLHLTLKKF